MVTGAPGGDVCDKSAQGGDRFVETSAGMEALSWDLFITRPLDRRAQ